MPANPEILSNLKQYLSDKIGGGDPPTGGGGNTTASKRIHLPDYNNPESRLAYAKSFRDKYGALMQGRGDTPLRINEKPGYGSDTSKNLSAKVGKQLGVDPALLYASSMEEGMSGLYPDKNGQVDYSMDKDFPVQGSHNFGLDNFVSRFPDLVKKGYLPQQFQTQFKRFIPTDPNATDQSANFKTTDDALLAKGAFLKSNYDEIDALAKKKGITLSPKARDFFALINYNAGSGTGQQMLTDYNNNGLLKDDSFLKQRPTSGVGLKPTSYAVPYENVIRRIQMADALKGEGYFDPPPQAAPQPIVKP